MLNGKFYTGLPPKMVERQTGNGLNRQESHFFWPDDTRVDSAVETRVKRRGSLEAGPAPRVAQTQRLSSLQADATPDVNTRQMFHKEFAKSSIQFYDNLQPNNNSSHNQSRLQRMRREVTPKLTDVEPDTRQLTPHKSLQQEDQRKQAYSSKIQFYDYVNLNEGDATQNNNRRPKMDMNNKREVELNTKNSPKLQVKHNVRHLSVEREQLSRMVTKKPLNDGQHWERDQYEPMRRAPVMLPKKILKQQPWIEDYDDDYIDNGMRQLRLRSPAPLKKHVTYNEEADEYAYYDDARAEPIAEGRQLRQSLSQPNMRTGSGQQQQQQQQQQRQQRGPYVETGRDTKSLNNYNKKSHNNYNNDAYNNYNSNNNYNNYDQRAEPRKMLPKLPELATATSTTTSTTLSTRTQRSRRFDDTLPTTATTTAAAAAAPAEVSMLEQLPSPSDPRKHLRSSLCFNGDALVVDVGAAAPSTSAVAAAAARRSSAGQRISVGLPD